MPEEIRERSRNGMKKGNDRLEPRKAKQPRQSRWFSVLAGMDIKYGKFCEEW